MAAAPNGPLTALSNSVLGLSNSCLDVSQQLAAVGNQQAAAVDPALQQEVAALRLDMQQLVAQTAQAALQAAAAATTQAAAMQQVQQALAAQQQQGAANAAALQQVQQQLAVGEARHRNNFPRQLNGLRNERADCLHPLVREQPGAAQGALPPAEVGFPATRAAALSLSNAALNNLADFYGQDFGQHGQTSLAERRLLFSMFIVQG